jgi:hypothetical protein
LGDLLTIFYRHDQLLLRIYRLVSLEVILNTDQLSSATTKARKKGKLLWNAFSDEGRLVLENFEEYQTPEQYV